MGGWQGGHKRLAGARVSMLGARLTSAGTRVRRQRRAGV